MTQAPAFSLAAPAILDDGWERGDAGAAGFDVPELQKVLARMLDEKLNLHGVLIERGGRLVVEQYRRGKDRTVNSLFSHTRAFGPEVLHDTRSVGKSVISLLIGIAIQQGKLRGADASIMDVLPEYASQTTPERRAVTVEHLLTMSSGLAWQEGGAGRDDEHHLMWTWSPCGYVLSRPMGSTPGIVFTYNSGGTAVLAEILARVTGRPWEAFARTVLFEPLGIKAWEWVRDFWGRPMSYTGLRMRPRDMVKLGRLVLNRGRWKGQQIVPEAWIEASLKPRLDTGFEGTQYGYHWWTGVLTHQGRALPWAAAFGNGGQRIYLVPDLDMTVVITAGAYGDLQAARRIQGFFREIVSTARASSAGPGDAKPSRAEPY
jgi:CubicO group peptidase (beta-lactamase class C family)